MYHFSESLAEFAADMTEGVSIGNMAIKPQTLYKGGMAVASAAGGAKGGDKASAGGGGASIKCPLVAVERAIRCQAVEEGLLRQRSRAKNKWPLRLAKKYKVWEAGRQVP